MGWRDVSLHCDETKGLDPSTSTLRTQTSRVASGNGKRVTSSPSAVCPSVCPSIGENGHEILSQPASDNGFADAVQAIMQLPLNDAEKAEAVRRLLAQAAGRLRL